MACIVSGLYQFIKGYMGASNVVGSTCCSAILFNGMIKRVILDLMLPGYFAHWETF